MTHPKKHQHTYPMRDVASVGRLNGGYPLVEGEDWYASLWGIGQGGLGMYSGVDMDAPNSQENESAESSGTAAPTGGTGQAAGTM